MPREVIEYRAVGVGRRDGEEYREAWQWTTARSYAVADLASMRVHAPALQFDEVFLERRTVTYGEPERVKEGEDGA